MNNIPCIYMRAGTSRGPFLDLRDLPAEPEERNAVLLRIMGSPHNRQIDGLGGATPVTSKVVMVQPSDREGVDVDYLFAQVFIDKPIVDTVPTCGNMMTGVGPFAVEKGWVKATDPETTVSIFNMNTKTHIEAIIQTPNGKVNYVDGEFTIDGVPGSGAPVLMNLIEVGGGTTGKLFPTGKQKEVIQGIEASIVDAGNVMVLMKAEDFGLSGVEGADYFDSQPDLMARLERIRQEAGRLAGLGDVSESVIPRMSLLSKARNGGSIKSQYFTPFTFHPTHAVSGAVCIGTACRAENTVASDLVKLNKKSPEQIQIEHSSGQIPVEIDVQGEGNSFKLVKAGVYRTCRKLMEGNVFY